MRFNKREEEEKKERTCLNDATQEEWNEAARKLNKLDSTIRDKLKESPELEVPYHSSYATSDGSTASYYQLPMGAVQLIDLMIHKDMNSQIGTIFEACYRYGEVSHSDKLRDAKKIKFYIEAEIERLEKL